MRKLFIRVLFVTTACFITHAAIAQPAKKYFTGDNTGKNELDRISRPADRATRDMEDLPAAASLKKYAPAVGNQGQYGTCVAWSSSYAARTISYCVQRNITDPVKINAAAFSPGYLYYQVKGADDNNCSGGANIERALQTLASKGDLLKSENIPDCTPVLDIVKDAKAKDFAIKAFTKLTETYGSISKNEISAIKKSLSEKKPVVISLKCYNSFFGVAADGAWTPKPNDANQGNHAMCVIGYDDNKFGGAFEVMNSWGNGWGNRGFVWITYPQMQQYGNYAVEMMDREAEQPEIKGTMDFVQLDGTVMPVTRSKITTRSITVEDDNKADYSSYRFKENYAGGTQFKIKFSINAPVFVCVFSVDDKGVLSKLFPYAADISPAINSANATVYFPSETKHARLNNDAGNENICVIYSKKQIDFEGLMSNVVKAPAKMYETIMDIFKDRIIPVKQVSFGDETISFSTKANENEMVCFFMNMGHK